MDDPVPTIYIVDDDESARRGLVRLIGAAGLKTLAFCSAAEFLARGEFEGPGCIILDVRMPAMTGPELHDHLRSMDYCMPIIFLSAHADVPIATLEMKKGAVNFLTKPVDREDLLSAIQEAVCLGGEHRSLWKERVSFHKKIKLLTPREFEVMTYVISGMLNKQIGATLEISLETIKVHRARMMHKLKVESVAELVRLCEHGQIDPIALG